MPNFKPMPTELKACKGRNLQTRYTEDDANAIAERLYNWAITDKNSHRSLRYYLLLHESVCDDDHGMMMNRYDFYKKTFEKAKALRADMLRRGLIEDKNALCKLLLPLMDVEYKAWKLEYNKIQTQQLDLFNGRLSKVIDNIDNHKDTGGA